MTTNVFFGIFPDDETRVRLEQTATELRRKFPVRGRWTNSRRYHLTLHFLGERRALPVDATERAQCAAGRVAAAAFTMTFDTLGSFRNREIPWWLGCSGVPEELTELHRDLGAELRREGIVPDAKPELIPHVTLLRGADHALETVPIVPVSWRVDEFLLIESRLGAAAEYISVSRWKLDRPR